MMIIELPAWGQCRNCKSVYWMTDGDRHSQYRLSLYGIPTTICAGQCVVITDMTEYVSRVKPNQVGESE